jgi:hypothetical protein
MLLAPAAFTLLAPAAFTLPALLCPELPELVPAPAIEGLPPLPGEFPLLLELLHAAALSAAVANQAASPDARITAHRDKK